MDQQPVKGFQRYLYSVGRHGGGGVHARLRRTDRRGLECPDSRRYIQKVSSAASGNARTHHARGRGYQLQPLHAANFESGCLQGASEAQATPATSTAKRQRIEAGGEDKYPPFCYYFHQRGGCDNNACKFTHEPTPNIARTTTVTRFCNFGRTVVETRTYQIKERTAPMTP